MSTTMTTDQAPAAGPGSATDVTTFRGRTLEELLPQIRERLGPDAVVVRQRDGLMGGVGGFFQQRFVEVEATAGHPRIDVYDEAPPETPESFAALLADAESAADPIVTATPPEAAPRIYSRSAGADSRSSSDGLAAELQQAGMSASFAERLLADAEAHELPFANGDLRRAVRRALARRIPVALPHRAGGLAVAFAGPGSTGCADALSRAYSGAGRRAHAVATLDQAHARIERGNPDSVLALDLPPIFSDPAEVAALAQRLRTIELDELLTVLPADLDLPSARGLHERLAPLEPTGFALVCDGPATALGAALELACATRVPLVYVLHGTALAPADPADLAERLLP